MEEELHEIFSELNGQHSRQEAEETQIDVDFPIAIIGTQCSDTCNLS
jgi:hypothetical protein